MIWYLTISCEERHAVVEGVCWEEVRIADIEFTRIDTLWTDNATLSFCNYIKGKASWYDKATSQMVLHNKRLDKNFKLVSNFTFTIVGDTIYHQSYSKSKIWLAGNEWYEVKTPNSYEWLRGFGKIPQPAINDSYGRVLKYKQSNDSLYHLQEIISIDAITDILDLTREGIYYVGLPGLNVLAKESFFDIGKNKISYTTK